LTSYYYLLKGYAFIEPEKEKRGRAEFRVQSSEFRKEERDETGKKEAFDLLFLLLLFLNSERCSYCSYCSYCS